jgi:repressor LexA
MKTALTPKEIAILTVIRKNIIQKGYPPSVREIGQEVGLSSSSTVHGYLKKLEQKGLVRRDATKPRAIGLLTSHRKEDRLVEIPVLGRVAAGLPLLAVENREDVFSLPVQFTGKGEFFILTVHGESMIDAGIFDGDMVVVRRQPTAENGEIVVALLEEEATIKRFFKEKGWIKLQPENSLMEPIMVREIDILGKVVGLLRKIA